MISMYRDNQHDNLLVSKQKKPWIDEGYLKLKVSTNRPTYTRALKDGIQPCANEDQDKKKWDPE
ncbi:unnamed protein product [Acanthoscelides obtectus]|uniref:Uncharacterized protein n=1 Tax=Acanthoscelides obtectus TaxID=200917 RepID=A0A9P0K8W3_ACAOB|nr:unnamed protein product [Acanthoscelides obtectus]CAK1673417.1 hypothetical protein AOBTE_LOCUS29330 [Acanthoscelides obtectus]